MEWSTYGLSDFLMFSPAVYWRLVAGYNAALWPLHWLALAGGAVLLWLTLRPAARPWAPCLLLAAACLSTGWGFHWSRYADIFLAAPWLAVACWVEAALLVGAAALRTQATQATPARGAGTVAGAVLMALALLFPVLAWPDWRQAEVIGLMPDPTALATLAWLLATRALPAWARVVLAVVPAVSLLLGLATRVALAQ